MPEPILDHRRNPSELESVLSVIRKTYETAFERVSVGDTCLDILQISDMEKVLSRLVDAAGSGRTVRLPFWSRVWPAEVVIGHMIFSLSRADGRRALEIGAGTGLSGLCAASLGYQTTIGITEHDALDFVRANILRNGFEDLARAQMINLAHTGQVEPADLVVGSEILKELSGHEALLDFLVQAVKPDGTILLATDAQRSALAFVQKAAEHFTVQRTSVGIRDRDGDQGKRDYFIYRLVNKDFRP
ncbi:MAG: hypothetical protein EOM25_09220 [Deltaproteobacteria bacterium]|nr:hypothetical protein [Deltaproteobacteria bacterium]